ncbi:MAG: flagellar motor switch protein FliN [Clostridiales bacterium]|jgi:flagellar motor switch protein FliN/FliY|nr:flagellar motor switch protein FliN [Clostridiales bacterium]
MQYDNFNDMDLQNTQSGENIGLILDVPLQITVELGKCKRSIRDILALHTGSVIVLDRLAGEMVDIMVNGKLFAKGEVVVIEDNYGVRVTDIIAMPQT